MRHFLAVGPDGDAADIRTLEVSPVTLALACGMDASCVDEVEEAFRSTLLRDKVTKEEIARIVARWTGIPVAKLTEGERNKTLHLDDELHKRVIGQDEAVEKVCEALVGMVVFF